MDTITLEQAFTTWFAEQLELQVDTEIFRGPLADTLATGVGVILLDDIPSVNPGCDVFNLQVIVKYNSRDAVWTMLDKLAALMPCYGVEIAENIVIKSMVRNGGSHPWSEEENSVVKYFGSFNCIIALVG